MIGWFQVLCWVIASFCTLTAAVLAMRAKRLTAASRWYRSTSAAVFAPGVPHRRRARRANAG